MRKIKEILFSENGMKVVNTLFFLAMFFYMSGLLFVAYIVWICYLVFCIRNTESRGKQGGLFGVCWTCSGYDRSESVWFDTRRACETFSVK